MTIFVPLTMFGMPFLSIPLFAFLKPQKAALWSFLLAWLFLPMYAYKFPLMPAYDKVAAASLGVLLSALIFDASNFMRFRPRWFDIPAIVFCFVPFLSCISSGLGVFAGIASVISNIMTWGIPYFVGRIYFSDAAGVRTIALGVVLAGLLYVPLCLYEVRMAPVLHSMIYGFHQHSFAQEIRYGGYRPTVFLQHGLAVAGWMATAATLVFWLWRMKLVRTVAGIPMWLATLALFAIVVLCKSFGPAFALLIGISIPLMTRYTGAKIPLVIVILLAPSYMALRTTGMLSTEAILSVNRSITDNDRTSSLSVRLHSEDTMLPRLLTHPLFGWGWGQYQLNSQGERDVITDGMWIIIFGRYGLTGLVGWTLLFTLPALFCLKYHAARITNPASLLCIGLSILLCLHLLDNLMNGMYNPIYLLIAGAILSQTRRASQPSNVSHPLSAASHRTTKIASRRLTQKPTFQPRT